MSGEGTVVQASINDEHGLIHAGGIGHAAFLSFRFADCNAPVLAQLQQGDIPPGSSFPVQFEIVLRSGSLVATNVT